MNISQSVFDWRFWFENCENVIGMLSANSFFLFLQPSLSFFLVFLRVSNCGLSRNITPSRSYKSLDSLSDTTPVGFQTSETAERVKCDCELFSFSFLALQYIEEIPVSVNWYTLSSPRFHFFFLFTFSCSVECIWFLSSSRAFFVWSIFFL